MKTNHCSSTSDSSVVVVLGDLYSDTCSVCGKRGIFGVASQHSPAGCVEAVKNGKVFCREHLPEIASRWLINQKKIVRTCKMKKDDFGDRMKSLERRETEQTFMPLLPIVVRLDGRSFHSYTSGFDRPIDSDFRKAMVETTKVLVEETNATIGYTQSDEITLVLYSSNLKSQIWFNGEKFKIVSCLASLCSVTFYKFMSQFKAGNLPGKVPTFDCRAYNVPNKIEAANGVLWRELDCTKNAISMASRCYYSHAELNDKSGSEKQEMLFAKGVNFNDYPAYFKRGTFVQRKKTARKFTADEIKLLPSKHQARTNPDLVVERTDVVEVPMPRFSSVINRVEVVFDGAEPIISKD